MISTDIKVRLVPRSSRNQIMGKEGEHFRIKVTPPPVDEKANQALIELLAKRLKRPKGDIEIISGKKARLKSVRIHGLSQEEVSMILEEGSGEGELGGA